MGLFSRSAIPDQVRAGLSADERVLASATGADGSRLFATRFGLWTAAGETATRIDWHVISRARLKANTLALTVAAVVDDSENDLVLLRDEPERLIGLRQSTRLTDIVHVRVRRSVAASRYLPWPGAGGWVVLRRVPGRDGLTAQVRLDEAADASAPGFLDAAAWMVADLWPADVPRVGASNEPQGGEDRKGGTPESE